MTEFIVAINLLGAVLNGFFAVTGYRQVLSTLCFMANILVLLYFIH